MCGIAGYWDLHAYGSAEMLHGYIAGMTQALVLRGPDSGGLWIEAGAGMALGHRRLALRDLSPLGHQPMTSPDGRFVLTYNGEIYNTGELTEFLAQRGVHPRGASDTEIVLLACMTLGVDAALEHLLACMPSHYGTEKNAILSWHETVWASNRYTGCWMVDASASHLS